MNKLLRQCIAAISADLQVMSLDSSIAFGILRRKPKLDSLQFVVHSLVKYIKKNDSSMSYFTINPATDRQGVTMLEDVAEVFQQRAIEFNWALANRLKILWETIGSSSDEASFLKRISTKVVGTSIELKNLLGAIYRRNDEISIWRAYLLSNPTHRHRLHNIRESKHWRRKRKNSDSLPILMVTCLSLKHMMQQA